jgi:catabolite regulation protein CreA
MAIVLLDSNILVDHLLAVRQETIEVAGYDAPAISAICWVAAARRLTLKEIAVFDQDLTDARIVILQAAGGHSLNTLKNRLDHWIHFNTAVGDQFGPARAD